MNPILSALPHVASLQFVQEKEERKQEIERLKKLKLEEIESKLQRLTENAGTDVKTMLGDKLEDDFNPGWKERNRILSIIAQRFFYKTLHSGTQRVYVDNLDNNRSEKQSP